MLKIPLSAFNKDIIDQLVPWVVCGYVNRMQTSCNQAAIILHLRLMRQGKAEAEGNGT